LVVEVADLLVEVEVDGVALAVSVLAPSSPVQPTVSERVRCVERPCSAAALRALVRLEDPSEGLSVDLGELAAGRGSKRLGGDAIDVAKLTARWPRVGSSGRRR